jgi:hypothetical protein
VVPARRSATKSRTLAGTLLIGGGVLSMTAAAVTTGLWVRDVNELSTLADDAMRGEDDDARATMLGEREVAYAVTTVITGVVGVASVVAGAVLVREGRRSRKLAWAPTTGPRFVGLTLSGRF